MWINDVNSSENLNWLVICKWELPEWYILSEEWESRVSIGKYNFYPGLLHKDNQILEILVDKEWHYLEIDGKIISKASNIIAYHFWHIIKVSFLWQEKQDSETYLDTSWEILKYEGQKVLRVENKRGSILWNIEEFWIESNEKYKSNYNSSDFTVLCFDEQWELLKFRDHTVCMVAHKHLSLAFGDMVNIQANGLINTDTGDANFIVDKDMNELRLDDTTDWYPKTWNHLISTSFGSISQIWIWSSASKDQKIIWLDKEKKEVKIECQNGKQDILNVEDTEETPFWIMSTVRLKKERELWQDRRISVGENRKTFRVNNEDTLIAETKNTAIWKITKTFLFQGLWEIPEWKHSLVFIDQKKQEVIIWSWYVTTIGNTFKIPWFWYHTSFQTNITNRKNIVVNDRKEILEIDWVYIEKITQKDNGYVVTLHSGAQNWYSLEALTHAISPLSKIVEDVEGALDDIVPE